MITCSCLQAACHSCVSCGNGVGYSMAQIWEMLLKANLELSPHNPQDHEPLRAAYVKLTNTLFNRRHTHEITEDDRCGRCFDGYLKWYALKHPLLQPQHQEAAHV